MLHLFQPSFQPPALPLATPNRQNTHTNTLQAWPKQKQFLKFHSIGDPILSSKPGEQAALVMGAGKKSNQFAKAVEKQFVESYPKTVLSIVSNLLYKQLNDHLIISNNRYFDGLIQPFPFWDFLFFLVLPKAIYLSLLVIWQSQLLSFLFTRLMTMDKLSFNFII